MSLASLIQPQTHQLIDSLYRSFLRLSDAERSVLIILSVIYKPIGINKLEQVIDILYRSDFLPEVKSSYRLSPKKKQQLIQLELLVSNKNGILVNKLLANPLTTKIELLPCKYELTAKQKVEEIIMAAEQVVPVLSSLSWQTKNIDEQRVIRDFYFLGKISLVEKALQFNKNPQIINHRKNNVLLETLFLPFDLEIFLELPASIQYQAFASLFRFFQKEGKSCEYPIQLLEQVCRAHSSENKQTQNPECLYLLAEQYLYQLRFTDLKNLLSTHNSTSYALQLHGAYCFLTGNNQQAVNYFEQALAAKNKVTKRKKQYLGEVLGYFYKLALMIQGNQEDANYYAMALQQIENEESDRKADSDFANLGPNLIRPIRCLSTAEKYNINVKYHCIDESVDFFCHQLNYLNYLLANVWCNQIQDPQFEKLALTHQAKFNQLTYPLFANLCQQLAESFNGASKEKTFPDPESRLLNIATVIKVKAQWDVALDQLIALNSAADTHTEPKEQASAKPIRLIWELVEDYEDHLVAREQKLNKSGWSKGRVVALKRLKEEPEKFDYLTDSDKKICKAIAAYQSWGYYSKVEYFLQGAAALEAAVGIENLYKAGNLTQAIELYKKEPELLVSQQGDELCLSVADISVDIDADEQQSVYSLTSLSNTSYQLTVFAPEHIRVAKIIGEAGLLIPLSAKQKALDGISAIAPFLNIQSNITELDTGLDNQECDPNLIVNIEPTQQGLTFTCVVMPFGEQGPVYKPAIGSASLTTELNGKRVATQRDLLREEVLLDQLDQACPAFLNMPGNILIEEDLQQALAILEQLETAITENTFDLILRWPKGKKINLTKTLDSAHLQLSFGKKSEWFDISGNLQINDEQVIEVRKLLELVGTSNGRFIELGSEQILALSEDLRHKLEQINQVTDQGKFHPLASLQIEEATTGMRMKTIHAWEQQTQKMHQANEIQPKIPSTFHAKLRDYQLEGYDWASRLAHWGAGACLADDMGLGKTLQALAVLLSRASQGASLVIAPTSVCFNWQQEALKFAPTLNIKLFSDATSTIQRKTLLSNLAPFDCVIISYGLLQRESDILKHVQWHSIIADEAQALKNPLTKRSKAAFALKGDFKMITTGTPIENDLTELWSLFRFINPGLLGNVKRFGERFSLPIENAKEDKLAARKASLGLKALIQPFILRRMKSQVLTELPPRTEINIQVKMSEKEQTFYEALRLNAIDNISQDSQPPHVGNQRIKMLAELMKLRQGCCNPKLIMAETNLPSAKLAALDELLEELRLNNHKALVFSQFVGHLQLIKQHIENKGFSYQYLDGATPQKERQKRVNAFQSGDGEVFLISLKAGGSGLNLTAADYVIHMDPWWNPAVEEQASDRAHRMGQKRPVTIYRLITQNTIEEKIVALHQHKRDLADKLLSDNETSTNLSVEDMLNLLKENF
ncbi:DEAD/DEAH box helicase [uncultured Paraglaciecola sp.]|uniref:DEAD/DEAH box helicase n=1 Tax=uncultured Paraglaciecola sp. TaxID=1765024 RepID=UPI0025918BDB|nr:DEAD/DEAH box helicase [uncultured Paraglaciecola sp.]